MAVNIIYALAALVKNIILLIPGLISLIKLIKNKVCKKGNQCK